MRGRTSLHYYENKSFIQSKNLINSLKNILAFDVHKMKGGRNAPPLPWFLYDKLKKC